jgi:hypothetical protein
LLRAIQHLGKRIDEHRGVAAHPCESSTGVKGEVAIGTRGDR